MTKAEFGEQFKRLRTAGYRLPVFEGITVDDVLTEWFATFGACSVQEFSYAIDELKKAKTDTFWPAPGELWAHVFEHRKGRRIRLQGQMPDYGEVPQAARQELAAMFRDFAQKLGQRMSMAKVSESVGQQEAADHALLEEEDRQRAAEGDACG